MHIQQLNNKSICILGYGKEGQAMESALHTYCPDADITIHNNTEIQPATSNQQLVTGPSYLDNLDAYDVIIKSPGIPPQQEFEAVNDRITNSTQIFIDTAQEAGSLVIGITGSKGKSTTSSLIYAILKHAGKDVHLVGNIGIPAIDYIEHAKSNTIFVQEMSSYQLLHMHSSPPIAVVTSFFPEHLDYHEKESDVAAISDPQLRRGKAIEAYRNAKAHITAFQSETDHVFYQADSQGATIIANAGPSQKHAYSKHDAPVAIEETQLIGEHNLSNIAGACAVAQHLNIESTTAIEAIQQFQGLPHRLQSLGVHHGIEWIDDAISTTPESTIAAIEALGPQLKCIILGGQDRGNDFTELAEVIRNSAIEHVILFPESGMRIKEALGDTSIQVEIVESMEIVVRSEKMRKLESQKENTDIPICLLSPASPSYNHYKNFEEKGDDFKRCVEGNDV